jgi:hypothetical protein
MIDASEVLGSRQLAGVRVSPVGLFRRIEANTQGAAGPVLVSGTLVIAIADKIGGERAGGSREADAEVSARTPTFGDWGFLAVTESDLGLFTTQPPKMAGRRLGSIVVRASRSTVVSADLAGGWRHPTMYVLSSAPLRISFSDGTAWAVEVSRFYRRQAKSVVRALKQRAPFAEGRPPK